MAWLWPTSGVAENFAHKKLCGKLMLVTKLFTVYCNRAFCQHCTIVQLQLNFVFFSIMMRNQVKNLSIGQIQMHLFCCL